MSDTTTSTKEYAIVTELLRENYSIYQDDYVKGLIDKQPTKDQIDEAFLNYNTALVASFSDICVNTILNDLLLNKIYNGKNTLNLVSTGNLNDKLKEILTASYDLVVEAPFDNMDPEKLYNTYFKTMVWPEIGEKGFNHTYSYPTITYETGETSETGKAITATIRVMAIRF